MNKLCALAASLIIGVASFGAQAGDRHRHDDHRHHGYERHWNKHGDRGHHHHKHVHDRRPVYHRHAPPHYHSGPVRYYSGPYLLGASEDAADDFSARYVFSQLGARNIEARAFDSAGSELARATISIDVVPGARTDQRIDFISPHDLGWYRNGIAFEVEATSGVDRVAYFAGPYWLGGSDDRGDDFAVRYQFASLGYRTITAVGYDRAGAEVARRSITIRVFP